MENDIQGLDPRSFREAKIRQQFIENVIENVLTQHSTKTLDKAVSLVPIPTTKTPLEDGHWIPQSAVIYTKDPQVQWTIKNIKIKCIMLVREGTNNE